MMNFSSYSVTNKDVQQWLKELFEGDEMPTFEETEDIMEALGKIMTKNKEAEKDVQEIMRNQLKHTAIYNKKTDELHFLLDGERLSLSSETLERVESIADLGIKLNLKEPTLTNFLLAINAVESKEMENKERHIIEDHHLVSLCRKVTKVMKTNDLLRRDLKILEGIVEPQTEFGKRITGLNTFLNKKIEDYKYGIKKYEKNLAKRNYDSSLQHHRLAQESESVKDLEKKVQGLKSKLDSFQSLPPNEYLTRLEIERAKEEVIALEEEFQKLLES